MQPKHELEPEERKKSHSFPRKSIVFSGITIFSIIGSIIIYKKLCPQLSLNIPPSNTIRNSISPSITNNNIDSSTSKFVLIPGHPRNLPSGQKASQKQLEIAQKLNIPLANNQTYVIQYPRKAS